MRWELRLKKVYLDQQSQFWVKYPHLREAINSIEAELDQEPDLMLFIERHADRLQGNVWSLPHGGLLSLVEVAPDDCCIWLSWLKLDTPAEVSE